MVSFLNLLERFKNNTQHQYVTGNHVKKKLTLTNNLKVQSQHDKHWQNKNENKSMVSFFISNFCIFN